MSYPNVRAGGAGGTGGAAWADEGSVAVAIVRELARWRGEAPAETSVQLYEHVDADALDQLLRHTANQPAAEWELTFTVEECAVTVTSDGTVRVR